MTDLIAMVYMNRGWWVADCPNPNCDHAEYFGVAKNGAGVGGLTPEYMMCPDCGRGYPAKWPPPEMRAGIEQILADRPNPKNRNWVIGEQLADLLWENAIHGVAPNPAAIEASKEDGGRILTVAGEEVTAGARAIGSPERLALPGGP